MKPMENAYVSLGVQTFLSGIVMYFVILIAIAIVAFFGSFELIRTQTTIGNRAFVRSMVPHHSGAVLMCQKASLTDPELVTLCGEIIKSQRQEIDQMKRILARLNSV
ncbi:MAG: DUF305 domain-containing protein [Afipia sp.]|nr:DUF305 domain-containing protein [Afipia sp.]